MALRLTALFALIMTAWALGNEPVPDLPLTTIDSAYVLEDFAWVSRTGYNLPALVSSAPRYTFWVLGNNNNSVMLMVRDESAGTGTGYDMLYVDLNRNKDLTEAGEVIDYAVTDSFEFTTPATDESATFSFYIKRSGSDEWEYPSSYTADYPGQDYVFPSGTFQLNNLPGNVKIQYSNALADAPVHRFGGTPLVFINNQAPGVSLGTVSAGGLLSIFTTVELRGSSEACRLMFHHSKLPYDGPIEAWFRELDAQGDVVRHLKMTWHEC